MGQEQTGSAAAQSKRAFEQITPTHGNTYASKLERRDLTAFYVSTDGAVVALESPYAAGPAFMSNAEAEAIGRELLKAAGAQQLSFDDALKIARGCTTYGGGYNSNPDRLEAYQHGIQTVINALTDAAARGLASTQVAALHTIGGGAA